MYLFNGPATTEIYTLSLHDALPIYRLRDAAAMIAGNHGDVAIGIDPADHTHVAAAPTPLMPCSYRVPRLELLSCSTNGTLVAAGGGDKVLFWDRRTQVCACGCRVARLLVGWNDACIAQLPGLPPPAHWPQTSPASLPLDETHRDCTH